MEKLIKTVLIIGAGNIASPLKKSVNNNIKTHAEAIYQLRDKFKLIGFVDPDLIVRIRVGSLWEVPTYESLDFFWAQNFKADIYVVCSPDNTHLPTLKLLSSIDSDAIIVEKPISIDLDQLNSLKSLNQLIGHKTWVNYSRRYTNSFFELYNLIRSEKYGKFLHGSGVYSKGLIHSGSHLLNVIYPLLERMNPTIHKLNSYSDYLSDESVDVLMKSTRDESYFTLSSIPSTLYETFELNLFFEKSCVRIFPLGYSVITDIPERLETGIGNFYLGQSKQIVEESFSEALISLYQNVYKGIEEKSKIECSIEDSLQTLLWCQKIKHAKS